MAKQTGHMVDDARLHPPDNSSSPFRKGGDFGDAGKSIGGEPTNPSRGDDEDEMMAPKRRGGY